MADSARLISGRRAWRAWIWFGGNEARRTQTLAWPRKNFLASWGRIALDAAQAGAAPLGPKGELGFAPREICWSSRPTGEGLPRRPSCPRRPPTQKRPGRKAWRPKEARRLGRCFGKRLESRLRPTAPRAWGGRLRGLLGSWRRGSRGRTEGLRRRAWPSPWRQLTPGSAQRRPGWPTPSPRTSPPVDARAGLFFSSSSFSFFPFIAIRQKINQPK